MVSTYSSVSGKWEPVSRNTTSMEGSTLTAMSMRTASWNEEAMASLVPNRSTAHDRMSPAGAVSNAFDRSSISACSSAKSVSDTSVSLVTMLTLTTLSVRAPLEPCGRLRIHRHPTALPVPRPCLPLVHHHEENQLR